jgi:hypothetical protein
MFNNKKFYVLPTQCISVFCMDLGPNSDYFRISISWTDRVRNEEVLHRVKEERNIVHTINRRKTNWIGHILRRKCLLKYVIEGKIEERIEMTGRRGRRRKQLLDDLKEKRRYWELKEEALDRTLWRPRFGRGYGSVVRQTTI